MILRPDSHAPAVVPDVLIATFLSNAFALAMPITILHVFDRVIPNRGTETLIVLTAALVVVAALDFLIRRARNHLISVRAFHAENDMHRAALFRVFDAGVDPCYFAADGLAQRFSGIGRIRKHQASEYATAALDVPFILLFIWAMVLISPVMGIGAGLLAVISLFTVRILRHRILALTRERQARDTRRHGFLTECIAGVETIKSLGIEPAMIRRYVRFMAGSVPITRDLSGTVNFTQGVAGTISLVSPVLMAGLGSVLVMSDRMTVGGLAAAVLLTGRVIQPTLRIEALLAGERDVRLARREVHDLLSAPIRAEGTEPLAAVTRLALEDVAVRNFGRAGLLFSDVSLDLARGDCISITGADGSGRSTLLSVLAGQASPASGRVEVNGLPFGRFDPEDVAARIAWLSAEETMLGGTLLDNMTGFRRAELAGEALALSRQMGLHDFIMRHPEGYDLRLDHGTARALPKAVHDAALMIAALARRPDVILFDEANLNFDRATDAALRNVLEWRKPDTIMVLVTYRPSLRSLADRHYSLVDGRLARIDEDTDLHGRGAA
jgi:ATP-binding cassette subfamily C protein LapB